MSEEAPCPPEFREFGIARLARAGEESLKARLLELAAYAHGKHGPLTSDKLPALLHDPECVRYPTRLVFEFGDMASHQFAQPAVDPLDPGGTARILYLRPALRQRPDLTLLAVSYMLPLINYGEVITDEHCLVYGAALLGRPPEEYYHQVCAVADFVEAEVKWPPLPASLDQLKG